MSFFTHRIRLHSLAVATTLALSVLMVASAFAEGRINLGGLQEAPTHDRFIVKYRSGSPQRTSQAALQRALLSAATQSGAGKALALVKVRRTATGAEVVQTSRRLDRVEAASLMRQLAVEPNVEYVEVDQLMQPSLTSDDTRYAEQWAYFETAGGIRADRAWDRTTGAGVVVAVIDTGITDHSDLKANIVTGYDMISDPTVAADGDGRDADPTDPGDTSSGRFSSWHGTHVSGTVAAVTNNAKGVAGTAFEAKVQPVRALGRGGGFVSDIADGVVWAAGGSVPDVPANANPAEVINMSLGGGGECPSTLQASIDAAVGRGTTVVVAAGNNGLDVANTTPANCKSVIAVAATDRSGARASFSNWGSGIDLSAPGVSILSTFNTGTTFPGTETYGLLSGTSMAAPHVAGVVALMQAVASSPLTPASVESVLKQTARALPVSCSLGCGAGIVDASAAVDAAIAAEPDPVPAPDPIPEPEPIPVEGVQTYTNSTDFAIADNSTVESPIVVSGRSGNAPSDAPVAIAIVHARIGDLRVDLVAPDGSLYNLHNHQGGGAKKIVKTVQLELSGEPLGGTWKLRVEDNANGNTGFINSWSITF